jgi:hypothetical protein
MGVWGCGWGLYKGGDLSSGREGKGGGFGGGVGRDGEKGV